MRRFSKISIVLMVVMLFVLLLSSCTVPTSSANKVIFEVDGVVKCQFELDGNTHLLPESPNKDGYIFIGWYNKNDNSPFTQKTLDKLLENQNNNSENIYVIAKFEKCVQVVFDYLDNNFENVVYNIDPLIEFSSIPEPSIKEYGPNKILGWFEDKTFKKPFNFNIEPKSDIRVYAKWDKPDITISFDSVALPDTQPIVGKYNELVTLPNIVVPNGYKIKYFYTVDNGVESEVDLTRFPSKNITVFPKLVVKNDVTVSFDFNSDYSFNFENHVVTIKKDSEFNKISTPTIPNNGPCSFIGWYYDKAFTKEFNEKVLPYENITVYAKWNIPNITISFDPISTDGMEPITKPYGAAIMEPTAPTRPNSTINMYYILVEGEKVEFIFNKMPESDITVYIDWISYSKIDYIINDKIVYTEDNLIIDNVSQLQTVTEGSPLYMPDYIFNGWYLDKSFTEAAPSQILLKKGSYTYYGKVTSRSFIPNLDKYQNTSFDKPYIVNDIKAIAEVLDYIYTFEKYESDGVWIENKTGIKIDDALNDAQFLLTGPNYPWQYSYNKAYPNIVKIFLGKTINEIKIKTKTPIIVEQKISAMVPINNKKRPNEFANFKYKEYPVFPLEISTSNQLFYVLQYGYKPNIVPGSVAEKMLNQFEIILKDIINDSMDEFDKVYAIYCWLVQNVEYDYKALDDEVAHASIGDNFYSIQSEAWDIEGVINSKLAVCDGISKAFLVMCRLEGIPCIRVIGPGHAWNKVYIDVDGLGSVKKAWYSVDATWGKPLYSSINGDYTMLSLDSFLIADNEKFNGENKFMGSTNHSDIVCTTQINPMNYINILSEYGDTDLVIDDINGANIICQYIHDYVNDINLIKGQINIIIELENPNSGLWNNFDLILYSLNAKNANDIDVEWTGQIAKSDKNNLIRIFFDIKK